MPEVLVNLDMPDESLAALHQKHPQFEFVHCTDRSAIYERLKTAEVLITFFLCSKRMLDAAPGLKWVQATSAGVDYLAVDEMARRNIVLTNGRGVAGIQMAEYAVAAMIALARSAHTMFRNQIEKRWDNEVPQGEIYGATLGILGLGAIGSEIAKRAAFMGMRVVGLQRTPQPREGVDVVCGPDGMAQLFKESDYIINLLPHTKQTEGIIDSRLFELMKPKACFINIGRGKTVNETDLIDALQRRTFRAMVSDVFENEPLPENSPLWTLDNVIITPHVCGGSPRYLERSLAIIDHNLDVYATGQGEMINVVDPGKGY